MPFPSLKSQILSPPTIFKPYLSFLVCKIEDENNIYSTELCWGWSGKNNLEMRLASWVLQSKHALIIICVWDAVVKIESSYEIYRLIEPWSFEMWTPNILESAKWCNMNTSFWACCDIPYWIHALSKTDLRIGLRTALAATRHGWSQHGPTNGLLPHVHQYYFSYMRRLIVTLYFNYI